MQLLVLDVANSKHEGKNKDMVVQGDKDPNVGVVRLTRLNGDPSARHLALQGIEAVWGKASILREFTTGLADWSRQQPKVKVADSLAPEVDRLPLNRKPKS